MPLIPCAACGHPISADARACPECGHPQVTPADLQRRERNRKILFWVGGCLLLIVLLVILVNVGLMVLFNKYFHEFNQIQ